MSYHTCSSFGNSIQPHHRFMHKTNTCFLCNYGFPAISNYSDNGKNCHGADKALKKIMKSIDCDTIQRNPKHWGIDWIYNALLASAQGGGWKGFKRSARCILSSFTNDPQRDKPLQETLITLFAEVQNIINSRPLTAVSSSIDDCRAITPNSLLHHLGRF